jgi:hypothetical protein
MDKEFSVLERLPNDGENCLAYGYKTFCCQEDMEKNPEWHNVTFQFVFSEYKLKKHIPKNLDESILEFCNYRENWKPNDDDEDFPSHLIGVTKWKKIIKN